MSIKKYALLIGNPGEENAKNYCPGVFADIKNYESFLKSPIGGAWNSSEIIAKVKPSQNQVISTIANIQSTADYAFIVFCGHGWFSESRNTTMLELNQNENIDYKELTKGAKKQLLILDCCRTKLKEIIQDSYKLSFSERRSQDSTYSRYYFEKYLEHCETGLIQINSCRIDESAGEDSKGGYFSSSLISEMNIDNYDLSQDGYRVIDIVDAFDLANRKVISETSGRQTPELIKGRRNYYFPFAVFIK